MTTKGSILRRQHSHQLDDEPTHLLPTSAGTHACYRSDKAVSSVTANRSLLLELSCCQSLGKRPKTSAPHPDILLGHLSSEASCRTRRPSKRTRLSRQNGLPRLPQTCHRLIPAKATSCFRSLSDTLSSLHSTRGPSAKRLNSFIPPASTGDTLVSFSFSWSKPRSSPRTKTISSIVSRISFSRSPPHTRHFRRHLFGSLRRFSWAKTASS